MGTWTIFLLAFSLISTHKLYCNGQLLGGFSTAMDIFYNGQMLLSMFESNDENEKIEDDIEDLKDEVHKKMKEILVKVEKLPGMQELARERDELRENSEKIFDALSEVTVIQKRINNGTIKRHEDELKRLEDIETELITRWEDSHDLLLRSGTTSFITANFYDELEEFENVCVTRMSHLQLLNTVLLHFELTAIQYFYARHIIINYNDFYDEGKEDKHDDERQDFNEEFQMQFGEVVKRLKNKMSDASSKFWRCDPAYFDDSTYRELQTFSRYMIDESKLPSDFQSCGNDCAKYSEKSRDGSELPSANGCIKQNCGNPSANECTWVHPCKARRCENKLIDCRPLPIDFQYSVCLSDAPNGPKRYSSIAKVNEQYNCPNNHFYMYSYKNGAGGFSVVISTTYTWQYKCICPEKEYYVSSLPSLADEGYVVIGAQLVLLNDNILFVKVKQGKPLPGGHIDSNSIGWPKKSAQYEKLAASFKTKISWEDCNEIDLTDNVISKERAITGLAFSDCENGRFRLIVKTKKFNYTSGEISGYNREEKHTAGTEEYRMDECDASTKAEDKNTPDSGDNDYVRFSLSSLLKDGGQSVIPYIDVQEVVPYPYTALSGASFIIRGQQGYGGFLALELRTYDMVSYIREPSKPDQKEIDESLAHL